MSDTENPILSEWLDHPVTKELRYLVQKQIEDTEVAMQDAYNPFEPQRTQEILAGLNGAWDTWTDIAEVLDGDWDKIEEIEDDSNEVEAEDSE